MKVGLLIFDDSPDRTLKEKAGRAARRYREKHGTEPNVCYAHPKDFEEVVGIEVKFLSTVLRHHLWIGVENES